MALLIASIALSTFSFPVLTASSALFAALVAASLFSIIEESFDSSVSFVSSTSLTLERASAASFNSVIALPAASLAGASSLTALPIAVLISLSCF